MNDVEETKNSAPQSGSEKERERNGEGKRRKDGKIREVEGIHFTSDEHGMNTCA